MARTSTPAPDKAKVGDTVDIGRAAAYVRLPDGTVVTCRGTYTARHAGEHVVFGMDESGTKLVELSRVEVA